MVRKVIVGLKICNQDKEVRILKSYHPCTFDKSMSVLSLPVEGDLNMVDMLHSTGKNLDELEAAVGIHPLHPKSEIN